MNQHATALRFNDTGILLIGPSGCGKSTLALELMAQGATLIADDQIILSQKNSRWWAICPKEIQNKIHLRDIGILHVTSDKQMPIDFIFQSDQPTNKLSTAPNLNIPIIVSDFMTATIIEKIKAAIHI